jgi:hypothetical protein
MPSYWLGVIEGTDGLQSMPGALQGAYAGTMANMWVVERTALRKRMVRRRWRRALIAARLLVVLHGPQRRNKAADVIRDFLEAADADNKARFALKAYIRRMKLLQQALKAALRFRQHIVKYIYMPAVWEVETRALGQAMNVSNRALNSEIRDHRRAWDPATREQEALVLGEARFMRHVRQNTLGSSVSPRSSVCSPRRRSSAVSQILITPQGKALALKARPESRLGSDFDMHRLTKEERDDIVVGLLHQGTDRYWLAVQDYRAALHEYHMQWQHWRLEALAIGPSFREAWPPEPVPPVQPTEMLKLDMPPLRAKVMKLLKVSRAGYLF